MEEEPTISEFRMMCPECGTALDVPATWSERVGPCPHCGKQIKFQTRGSALRETAKNTGIVIGGFSAATVGCLIQLFLTGAFVVGAAMFFIWVVQSAGCR